MNGCRALVRGVVGQRRCFRRAVKRFGGVPLCRLHAEALHGDAKKHIDRPDLDVLEHALVEASAAGITVAAYLHQVIRTTTPPLGRSKQCAVDGCQRLSRENGMCVMHSRRVKAHGDPHARFGRWAP